MYKQILPHYLCSKTNEDLRPRPININHCYIYYIITVSYEGPHTKYAFLVDQNLDNHKKIRFLVTLKVGEKQRV